MSTSPLSELHEALAKTSAAIECDLDRLSDADAEAAQKVLDAIAEVPNAEEQQAAFARISDELDQLSATMRRLARARTDALPLGEIKRVEQAGEHFDRSHKSQPAETV